MTFEKLSVVMGERIYSAKEAGEVLNSCEQMVRRWVSAGQIVAIKVGRRYGIRESALRDFLNNRTTQK